MAKKLIIDEKFVAQAVHEVNRAYCLALGDKSQPSFENAAPHQLNSIASGIAGILSGERRRAERAPVHGSLYGSPARTAGQRSLVPGCDRYVHRLQVTLPAT